MTARSDDLRPKSDAPDEMRDFLLTLRRALMMIVAYIDRRYGIESGGRR